MGGNIGNYAMGGTAGLGLGLLGKKGENDFRKKMESLGPDQERAANPALLSTLNADGSLQDQYKMKDASAWNQAMLNKQGQEELGARDLAQKMGQTQAATARSQLASRAGLRGGAAERLAGQSARSTAEQQQMATRQGADTRANVGVKTEELNRAADQMNISNALAGVANQNEMRQRKYEADMGEWAAGKQAKASMMAGKGKGQQGGIMGGVGAVTGK